MIKKGGSNSNSNNQILNLPEKEIYDLYNTIQTEFGNRKENDYIIDIQGITAGNVNEKDFNFFNDEAVDLIFIDLIVKGITTESNIVLISQGDRPSKGLKVGEKEGNNLLQIKEQNLLKRKKDTNIGKIYAQHKDRCHTGIGATITGLYRKLKEFGYNCKMVVLLTTDENKKGKYEELKDENKIADKQDIVPHIVKYSKEKHPKRDEIISKWQKELLNYYTDDIKKVGGEGDKASIVRADRISNLIKQFLANNISDYTYILNYKELKKSSLSYHYNLDKRNRDIDNPGVIGIPYIL